MNESKPLPRYQSHKVVEALKIGNVIYGGESDSVPVTVVPADLRFPMFGESPAWFKERFKGSENDLGYWVRYADGYTSWSPSKAFEEGYSLVEDKVTIHGIPVEFIPAFEPRELEPVSGPWRELDSHRVNGLNEALKIQVLDEPGHGGACHRYHITTVEIAPPPETDVQKCMSMSRAVHDIRFQDGPIQEVGVNGASNEALLAIVEDRLVGFQSGPFACRENAIALTKLQEAMMWLQKRTRDRAARGVEGTNQK